jgi:hypothetical protein
MVKPPPPPSQLDTIEELLGSSRRDALPLRHVFAQQRDKRGDPLPGPLAAIVRRGVTSALEQYLLLHARAAGRPHPDDSGELQYDVCLESRVWARALGLAEDESGQRTVQRNWQALGDLRLVDLERSGRLVRVTLLHEDGSGAPYTHPGDTRDSPYLRLPYSYWLDGHAAKLKMPGKAMLLIAMTRLDWFSLPFTKGPTWYGIGASTVARGLRELRRLDLLDAPLTWKKAPLTATGWTQDMRYRLREPFGPVGKAVKGAPPELLPQPEAASPPRQADSADGKPKRRNPAATKRKGRPAGGVGRKPNTTTPSSR